MNTETIITITIFIFIMYYIIRILIISNQINNAQCKMIYDKQEKNYIRSDNLEFY
jgi:ascorbate-specific PTS system EIIC-type component UlaA